MEMAQEHVWNVPVRVVPKLLPTMSGERAGEGCLLGFRRGGRSGGRGIRGRGAWTVGQRLVVAVMRDTNRVDGDSRVRERCNRGCPARVCRKTWGGLDSRGRWRRGRRRRRGRGCRGLAESIYNALVLGRVKDAAQEDMLPPERQEERRVVLIYLARGLWGIIRRPGGQQRWLQPSGKLGGSRAGSGRHPPPLGRSSG
jgi:hypothetical protein